MKIAVIKLKGIFLIFGYLISTRYLTVSLRVPVLTLRRGTKCRVYEIPAKFKIDNLGCRPRRKVSTGTRRETVS